MLAAALLLAFRLKYGGTAAVDQVQVQEARKEFFCVLFPARRKAESGTEQKGLR